MPHYRHALDMILDFEHEDGEVEDEQVDDIERAAESLYGYIHARFILSNRGLALMLEKYKNEEFGHCPRVKCENQPVVPVGMSDVPGQQTVKVENETKKKRRKNENEKRNSEKQPQKENAKRKLMKDCSVET